jgi:hypothetical protein
MKSDRSGETSPGREKFGSALEHLPEAEPFYAKHPD